MATLFRRVILDRRILNQVLHHAVIWQLRESGYMIAVSWALAKGDWWKDKNDDVATFFGWDWKKNSDIYVRSAIYIGRLAIVWQTRPKGSDSTATAQ